MIVSSTAFLDKGTIPLKHTGFGEDISPELSITNVPEGTISFVVILDDLDVPWTKEFTHWIVWNTPVMDVIPEGLPKGANIYEPISACQGIAWGKHGYREPKQPVFIRKEHRYVFTVYALDCKLDISAKSNKKILHDAMKGHILAEAELMGKYKRMGNVGYKMIAYCGLDCEKCDTRKATVNNDDALREKTAKLWTELNGVEITKEMINCMCCCADGVK